METCLHQMSETAVRLLGPGGMLTERACSFAWQKKMGLFHSLTSFGQNKAMEKQSHWRAKTQFASRIDRPRSRVQVRKYSMCASWWAPCRLRMWNVLGVHGLRVETSSVALPISKDRKLYQFRSN